MFLSTWTQRKRAGKARFDTNSGGRTSEPARRCSQESRQSMRHRMIKTARGVKRLGMNLACMTPIGRRLILPPAQRAKDFGPSDAGYSWRLFGRQFDRLREVGYEPTARRILDVGPGRNIGSSLLWWAASGGGSVSVKSPHPAHTKIKWRSANAGSARNVWI